MLHNSLQFVRDMYWVTLHYEQRLKNNVVSTKFSVRSVARSTLCFTLYGVVKQPRLMHFGLHEMFSWLPQAIKSTCIHPRYTASIYLFASNKVGVKDSTFPLCFSTIKCWKIGCFCSTKYNYNLCSNETVAGMNNHIVRALKLPHGSTYP